MRNSSEKENEALAMNKLALERERGEKKFYPHHTYLRDEKEVFGEEGLYGLLVVVKGKYIKAKTLPKNRRRERINLSKNPSPLTLKMSEPRSTKKKKIIMTPYHLTFLRLLRREMLGEGDKSLWIHQKMTFISPRNVH